VVSASRLFVLPTPLFRKLPGSLSIASRSLTNDRKFVFPSRLPELLTPKLCFPSCRDYRLVSLLLVRFSPSLMLGFFFCKCPTQDRPSPSVPIYSLSFFRLILPLLSSKRRLFSLGLSPQFFGRKTPPCSLCNPPPFCGGTNGLVLVFNQPCGESIGPVVGLFGSDASPQVFSTPFKTPYL